MVDEDGEELDEHLEGNRFREARAGDHLMTPFQCELCHYRNIFGEEPDYQVAKVRELTEFFRRASLDAFWSRASSTVKGNLSEGKRSQRFADRFGIPSLAPPMGPFPLSDSMGMAVAAAILDRSMDRGITEEFVQWETFRGMRSFVTNVSQAGVAGLSDVVAAHGRNSMWISGVVTHSFWFTRFMDGLHKRVGEVVRQDEPISIDVLHAIEGILELEWDAASTAAAKRKAAEMGTWFVAGFCGGLRGEEMPLIEFAGTKASLTNLCDQNCPHFILVITGRTKGNQKGGAKFGVPIVATTEGTYLRPGKWTKRLCDLMTARGISSGRLFKRNLAPAKLFEFEHDFYRLLRAVQATTTLIDKSMDVDSEYGILRSCRRGMTSHAINMGVTRPELDRFNRWSKERNAKAGVARLDMQDTYASLPTLTPTLLRVTRVF